MTSPREWIESDGLGGFAMGPVIGAPFRRYHGLLIHASQPPLGRLMLVNSVLAEISLEGGTFALNQFLFAPRAVHPAATLKIGAFEHHPWPRWDYLLPFGATLRAELFMARGTPATFMRWTVSGARGTAVLKLRFFISGRDYHHLHHANPEFQFNPEITDQHLLLTPYAALPSIGISHNGKFDPQPDWYYRFLYSEEQHRGYEAVEDLATPGVLTFDFSNGPAMVILAPHNSVKLQRGLNETFNRHLKNEENRRQAFASPLHRAAKHYIVSRGAGKTVLAGYPWFADWGRDTCIAVRGLATAAGDLGESLAVLENWSLLTDRGMIPNRFIDEGGQPEFNSADAALWFIIAARDLWEQFRYASMPIPPVSKRRITEAAYQILSAYRDGTRFNIAMDSSDGLLRCGDPSVQLTWMDAKLGNYVVTPRAGKPVEICALWINALRSAALLDLPEADSWNATADLAARSFARRFWYAEGGYLYDVIDVDHRQGQNDARLRPNQILAVGGLPLQLLPAEHAALVVATIERELLTVKGLRTLARGERGYAGSYQGSPKERDLAYHQGTVWPWLMGPFIEAWVRVHGSTKRAKETARKRYFEPFLAALDPFGTGHLPEIADGDPPHLSRGCPFQAWSVGEALRVRQSVLN